MNATAERLLRLHRARKGRPYQFSTDVFAGIETRTVPRDYYFEGRTRGDEAHPDILFQYTLRGWGHYVEGGTTTRLTSEMAFLAVLPSAHVYYLPNESPEWTFFWITIRHPYVASRLAQMRKRAPAVATIEDGHVLLASAVKVLEGVGLGTFRDAFAREASLFEFLIEYERFAHESAYSRPERERLLAETRASVLADLSQPPDVSQLAEKRGMSRSHFGHWFKDTTGLSPAQFVTDVRMQEVSRRLLGTRETLKTIAADTGFADANHLCKVFRRHYHLSPGAFRRQMR